jgi:hypothetical protein
MNSAPVVESIPQLDSTPPPVNPIAAPLQELQVVSELIAADCMFAPDLFLDEVRVAVGGE